jgi:hypothetical protein
VRCKYSFCIIFAVHKQECISGFWGNGFNRIFKQAVMEIFSGFSIFPVRPYYNRRIIDFIGNTFSEKQKIYRRKYCKQTAGIYFEFKAEKIFMKIKIRCLEN